MRLLQLEGDSDCLPTAQHGIQTPVMTTPNQIAQAKKFAEECKNLPTVVQGHVDDWGNDGSFSIFVTVTLPSMRDVGTACAMEHSKLRRPALMHKIQALICKLGGHYEWHQGPRMTYKRIDGRKYRDGYDTDQYHLSVRFDDRTPEPEKPKPKYACLADVPEDER